MFTTESLYFGKRGGKFHGQERGAELLSAPSSPSLPSFPVWAVWPFPAVVITHRNGIGFSEH